MAARTALKLDTVYLVPARIPPHRARPVASQDHRLAMVKLAAADHPWLRVSEVELLAPGPSYTTDTLDRLQARGEELSSLYVTTGADAFAEILSWKGAPGLLDRCHFIVVSRPGRPASDLRRILPALASRMVDAARCEFAAQPSIFLVDAPTAPVTATEVRSRVSAGLSIEGLVPEAVMAYINRHELYQGVA